MSKKCYVIPVQKACSCDCSFCITKVRNYQKESEYLKLDHTFSQQLYNLKKQGINNFEITGGGEPTLHPQIQEIIFKIKEIIPNSTIKLYTNGYYIPTLLGIDEIDVSVVSYDQTKNNDIMHPPYEMNIIKRLFDIRQKYSNIMMRLSIPLLSGGIETASQLEQFISLTPFVDSYVVRTLYPNTENRTNSFIDFSFQHPKVVMEKDNDISEFDGYVLWSDGQIYHDWNLNKKRNLLSSYILLKPDSQTYFPQIFDFIKQKGFQINAMYLMNSFVEQALLLYEDKKDDIKYYQIVKRHLESLAYLFGNKGIIMLLNNSDFYENLVKDTYKLKIDIRHLYSFTHACNGYLKINDEITHLNLVHAPDGIVDYYLRDLDILQNNNIINSNNKIDNESFQKIKQFNSYRGIL